MIIYSHGVLCIICFSVTVFVWMDEEKIMYDIASPRPTLAQLAHVARAYMSRQSVATPTDGGGERDTNGGATGLNA